MKKTNAMRILDTAKIKYETVSYDISDGLIDAVSVSEKTGQDVDTVFKTLVTKGKSGEHFVYVIPAKETLDLKEAAKVANEKSVEMIPVADILKTTGYIRGGCSPIGMKKKFKTFIHTSCQDYEEIFISGGLKGVQIGLSPLDLKNISEATFCDIIMK